MWKSRKTLVAPIFSLSTPLWKKDVEKNWFYTDFLFPHYSFSFSLANVEKIRSMAVVDIGLDFLHRLGESGVFFHLLFYLLERVEHRGVIPVVKDLPISTTGRLVMPRMRYMAIWRAATASLTRC